MRISEKIKCARLNKEYTQEQAAENLMVSRQTISNWETGRSLPDIISIIRMSELYGLSLDELLKKDKELMDRMEKDSRAVKAEKSIMKYAWISVAIGIAMLILGLVFVGNPVIDFISGALPWVLLGIMLLSAILYLNREKRNKERQSLIIKSLI